MPSIRIGVGGHYRDDLFPKIDNSRLPGLKSASRTKLFMYAVALGVKDGTPSEPKNKVDIVRPESIDHKSMAQMLSLLIAYNLDHKTEQLEISDDEAIRLAERYANTGFGILEKQLSEYDDDHEDFLWSQIADLNEEAESLGLTSSE